MSPRTPLLDPSLGRRKPSRSRRSFVPTQVGLSALEPRLVQSTAVLSQGVLTVTGTAGNDAIAVVQSGSSITAAGKSFALGSVNSIVVNGLDGKDTITVTSTKPATLNGGAGDDVLKATSGKDRLVGGNGTNSYPGVAASDIVVDPKLTNGAAINKAIMDKDLTLTGGMISFLWSPTKDQVTVGGVTSLETYGGAIYWTPSTGALVVKGDIQAKYKALGGPSGFLGLPTGDPQSGAGMTWSYFRGGVIVSSPSTGAHEVHGAILDKYVSLGGGGGRLGAPTSDEVSSGSARVSHFQNGSIYWSGQPGAGLGAHVLYGSIRDRYVAMGGPTSFLGLPIGDQLSYWAGDAVELQGGTLVAAPNNGPAFEVHGAIRDKYYALGGGLGTLGLPVSDEYGTADGARISRFQNGEILWRPSTGARLLFTRNEVVGALKRSELDGVLDAGEFALFQGIAHDLSMYVDQYVRDLTSNLIDGDRANATFQGAAVGNLYVNCPSWMVDRLERKWFEGQDHPGDVFNRTNPDKSVTKVDGGAYQYAAGPLFGPGGPSYTDIDQGNLGDCFFLAALAETAYRSPSTIRNMFIDNGDGTFTVRFYNFGGSEYVTVDRMLPGGGRSFAHTGAGPIWVALAEKAYAQLNQSGWLDSSSKGTNWYGALEGGDDRIAIAAITGMTSTAGNTDIGSAWAAGKYVLLSTSDQDIKPVYLVPDHVYAVVGYNASTGQYTLFNPWGVNGGHMPDGSYRPGFIYEYQSLINEDFVGADRAGSAPTEVARATTPTPAAGLATVPAPGGPTTIRLAAQGLAAAPEAVADDAVASVRPDGGHARTARGGWASRRWATGPIA